MIHRDQDLPLGQLHLVRLRRGEDVRLAQVVLANDEVPCVSHAGEPTIRIRAAAARGPPVLPLTCGAEARPGGMLFGWAWRPCSQGDGRRCPRMGTRQIRRAGHRDPSRRREPITDAWPTTWWHALEDGRVQCDLCPRNCRLHEGQRGLCFVRARQDDAIVLTTYGRSSGYCVDPVEKKPLNHFLPGLVGALLRHRGLQPHLQVLPELGHLQVARHRHAWPTPRRRPPSPRRPSGSAARASPSPTTIR